MLKMINLFRGLFLDKKNAKIVLILGLFSPALNAQTLYGVFDLKQMVPTSPEVAMLGRFGDIPIGYYTGTADVSVPIYTIKEGGLEIPIVLSYHGSGIKVEDEASNVGLGWSMEPGGAIIQVVNGKPDAEDLLPSRDPAGYDFLLKQGLNSSYFERSAIDSYLCHNTGSGDSFQTLTFLTQGLGQPDVYSYNFAGYSGKYSIDPVTNKIVLLDKKTDIVFTGDKDGMIAKTMNGNIFHFGAVETSMADGVYVGYTSKLTKIELTNGKVITFVYQTGNYSSTSYNETYHSPYPFNLGNDNNIIVRTSTRVDHSIQMLTKIVTDEVEIDFNLQDREDLVMETPVKCKSIHSVDIKDVASGLIRKSFSFNYNYFVTNPSQIGGNYTSVYDPPGSSANPGLIIAAKRLKLLSVQEVGYTPAAQPITKPAYQFAYNETIPLPVKSSFSRDFWGYYGYDNNKLLPDLSFYSYSGDGDYLSMPPELITNVNGANRSPDSTKMQAGMLTRITYPTGGYTEFDYETHKFGNHVYPDLNLLKNATVLGFAHDTNNQGDQTSVSFTLPRSETIFFSNNITRGRPDVAIDYGTLSQSTITLTKKTASGVTSVLRTWRLTFGQDEFNAAGGTVNFNESVPLSYDAGAVYTITTYLPDELGQQSVNDKYASVSSNFSYDSGIPPNLLSSSYGGGLRVKAIRNYTKTGELAGKKIIKYVNADQTTSGKLMSPLKSLYKRKMYAAEHINETQTFFDAADVWFIASESVVPLSTSAGGSIVGYSRVEENNMAPDGSINGRHVYNYHNQESQANAHVPDNPDLQNGLLQKEEIYNNSSAIPLVETNYEYIDKQSYYFDGVKIASTYIGADPCGIPQASLAWVETSPYQIYIYPIFSHWWVLDSKEKKESFDGNIVTERENYTYNSKGQMIVSTTHDSKGREKSTEYLYPIDNPDDPMSATLIDRGLYNNLQLQTEKISNYPMSKVQTGYRLENNLVVQSDIVRTNGAYPPYNDITFDKYGPNSTLQQFTKDGPPTSVLWSFSNSKPIAVIKNVNFSSLQDLLGTEVITNFSARLNPSKTDIDNFLAPLSSLFVTKYAYDPIAGMTSQTDSRGMVTSYEYDEFQRLLNIKDLNGNIVKNFLYHFADPGSVNTQNLMKK